MRTYRFAPAVLLAVLLSPTLVLAMPNVFGGGGGGSGGGGGGSGDVTAVTSTGSTLTITNSGGPIPNIELPSIFDLSSPGQLNVNGAIAQVAADPTVYLCDSDTDQDPCVTFAAAATTTTDGAEDVFFNIQGVVNGLNNNLIEFNGSSGNGTMTFGQVTTGPQFVFLSGTSGDSAFQAPAGSIGSNEIVDSSITASDLGTAAVTSPKMSSVVGPGSDPALNANQAFFEDVGGIVFEGTSADTIEGSLRPTTLTADRFWTLPDKTGTVTLGIDWDTAAEINAATTDADFATLTGAETFATGTKIVTSKFDFGGGTLEVPNGTSTPGSCTVGDFFVDTDATTGQRLYLCESSNTWVVQGAAGATLPAQATAPSDPSAGAFKLWYDTDDSQVKVVDASSNDYVLARRQTADPTTNALMRFSNSQMEEAPGATVSDLGVLTVSGLATGSSGMGFTATDAITTCTTFGATNGGIYYDDSEGKFKACVENTITEPVMASTTPTLTGLNIYGGGGGTEPATGLGITLGPPSYQVTALYDATAHAFEFSSPAATNNYSFDKPVSIGSEASLIGDTASVTFYGSTADGDPAPTISATWSDQTDTSEDADVNITAVRGGAIYTIIKNIGNVVSVGESTSSLTLPNDGVDAAEIDDNACTSIVSTAFNPDESATSGAAQYASLRTGTTDATVTNVDDWMTANKNMKATSIFWRVDVAPGASANWTATLVDDGSDTTATATGSNNATSGSNSVTSSQIAAGSKLAVKAYCAGTCTAAAEMIVSVCLNPD